MVADYTALKREAERNEYVALAMKKLGYSVDSGNRLRVKKGRGSTSRWVTNGEAQEAESRIRELANEMKQENRDFLDAYRRFYGYWQTTGLERTWKLFQDNLQNFDYQNLSQGNRGFYEAMQRSIDYVRTGSLKEKEEGFRQRTANLGSYNRSEQISLLQGVVRDFLDLERRLKNDRHYQDYELSRLTATIDKYISDASKQIKGVTYRPVSLANAISGVYSGLNKNTFEPRPLTLEDRLYIKKSVFSRVLGRLKRGQTQRETQPALSTG